MGYTLDDMRNIFRRGILIGLTYELRDKKAPVEEIAKDLVKEFNWQMRGVRAEAKVRTPASRRDAAAYAKWDAEGRPASGTVFEGHRYSPLDFGLYIEDEPPQQ